MNGVNGINGIHSNGVNGFHHEDEEEPMTNGYCNGMNTNQSWRLTLELE